MQWMMRLGLCARPYITATQLSNCLSRQVLIRRLVGSISSRKDEVKDNGRSRTSARRKPEDRKTYEYSSPEATFARHVLRTILRECTYLPDSVAAEYIKQHALARFRANGYKAWKNPELFEAQDKLRRQEARQVISQLQRANEGERKCLLKVLHTAYGRIGKRRHELMKPLLPVKGQNEVLSAASDSRSGILDDGSEYFGGQDAFGAKDSNTKLSTTKLSPSTPLDLTHQLRALLKSQIRAQPPDTTRSNPKRIEPSIPELNSWRRPTPQKVIRNARNKHYAMLLDRVQPPLPMEEWKRLRDLASGKILPEAPVVRRKKAAEYEVGDRAGGESALEMVARYGKVPKKIFGNRDAHHVTPRFMQRLYAEVFSQCPVMEWDNAREKWKVTWGSYTPWGDAEQEPSMKVDKAVAQGSRTSNTIAIEANS